MGGWKQDVWVMQEGVEIQVVSESWKGKEMEPPKECNPADIWADFWPPELQENKFVLCGNQACGDLLQQQ